jgi:hypothetical protein
VAEARLAARHPSATVALANVTATSAATPRAVTGDLILEMQVCLTADGRLDAAGCGIASERFRIRLLRHDREEWAGVLLRSDGNWTIHRRHGDDDPLWLFESKIIRPGEYFSIRQPQGEQSFLVVRVY